MKRFTMLIGFLLSFFLSFGQWGNPITSYQRIRGVWPYERLKLNNDTVTSKESNLLAAVGGKLWLSNGSFYVDVTGSAGASGVSSFNGRSGSIVLNQNDVNTALTYIPISPSDTSGMLSGYVRTQRFLDSVYLLNQRINSVGTPPVSSVFGRTGSILAQESDYGSFFPTIARFLDTTSNIWNRVQSNYQLAQANYSTTYSLSNDIRDSLSDRYTKNQINSLLLNKLNISDTSGMLSNYRTTLNSVQVGKVNYSDTASMLSNYVRNGSISGYVPTSRTLTINGTTLDLSANRSFTVGDVVTSGSYSNPAWITSLAWGKITDAPSFITGNQTITLSGDATGSGATSIAVTLANSGVTAGTYTKVTVDAKGRVTTGTSLASSDVTTALGFTPYNSSNPSGFITSSALSPYALLSGATFTGQIVQSMNGASVYSSSRWINANSTADLYVGTGGNSVANVPLRNTGYVWVSTNADLAFGTNDAERLRIAASGAITAQSSITASQFNGSGAGLTGTASSLSIGGNASTASNSTLWNSQAYTNTELTTAPFYFLGYSTATSSWRPTTAGALTSWLGLGSYAYRSSGLAELSGATFTGDVVVNSKVGIGTSNLIGRLNIATANTRREFDQVNATTPYVEILNSDRSQSLNENIYVRGFNVFTRSGGTGSYVNSFSLSDAGAAAFSSTGSFGGNLSVTGSGRILGLRKSSAFTGNLYVGYQNEAGTETAFVGYGSGSNNTFSIVNTLDAVLLQPSGGNVGIGTTSPAVSLHVRKDAAGALGGQIAIDNSASSTLGNAAELSFLTNNGASATGIRNGRILVVNENAGNGAARMEFHTWDGAASAVRLTIASTGATSFLSSVTAAGIISSANVTVSTGQIEMTTNIDHYIDMRSASAWNYRMRTLNDDFIFQDVQATEFVRFYYNGGGSNKFVWLRNTQIGGTLSVTGATTFSDNVTISTAAGSYPRYISTVGSKSWEIGYRSGTTSYEIREDGTTRFAIANGGAITASLSITATSFFESSDIRLKEVFIEQDSKDGMNAIFYRFKGKEQLRWGYSAQAVQKVLPYAVQEDNKGFLSVDYTTVHTYKIAELERRVTLLENQLKAILNR